MHRACVTILEDCSLVELSLALLRPGISAAISRSNTRFFPGCIYLLSMYYKRWELQQRIVYVDCEILLISGMVLLRFHSRSIIRRSTCLCHSQNEWPQWKTWMGMDLHHRGNHISRHYLMARERLPVSWQFYPKSSYAISPKIVAS